MALERLILVRHGESEGNVAAAEADRTHALRVAVPARDADVVLTALGREQAADLGDRLARLDAAERPGAVRVSPYVRARETASIALERAGLGLEPEVDERLRDRELGILDALTWRGIVELHPDEAERRRWLGKYYHRPPGGESWADVQLRVRSALHDLDGQGGTVLVVCHDAVIWLFRAVLEHLGEQELLDAARRDPIKNASLTVLERDGAGWRATLVNDVGHVEEPTVHGRESDDVHA
ncbi:histidine phosphatase family protein [Amnibacterium sp. CER49]|uniref:histidine phosphatase family protein n=1 Tax=Amnibacterium sp. CER49 TaxID=3039161 RepID=UPI002447D122|nr:histidine phosphatase family protein [Amnibacterium sp. CER49]MDH2445451.1 histidine phosphatase family protein [Amnibacterium sp. CER49]